MTLISLATDLLIVSTYFYHKVTDRLWVSEIFLPMLNYFFFAFENIFYWNVKCIWSWIFGKIMKFLWSQATLFSKSVGISTLFSLPFPITIIAYSPVVHVHLFPMTTEFLHLRHPAQHSQHLLFLCVQCVLPNCRRSENTVTDDLLILVTAACTTPAPHPSSTRSPRSAPTIDTFLYFHFMSGFTFRGRFYLFKGLAEAENLLMGFSSLLLHCIYC